MKYYKVFHFWGLVLIFIVLWQQTRSVSYEMFRQGKQQVLFSKLDDIDQRIKEEQYTFNKIQNQQLIRISYKTLNDKNIQIQKNQKNKSENSNVQVSSSLKRAIQQIYKNLPQFYLSNIKQSQDQIIQVRKTCEISHSRQQNNILSLEQSKMTYFYVYVNGELLILVNKKGAQTIDQKNNSLQIYSSMCQLLIKIPEVGIKFIFEEERGTGNYHFSSNKQSTLTNQQFYAISNENELIAINIAQVKKYKDHITESMNQNTQISTEKEENRNVLLKKFNFYRVLNNKLILSDQKLSIIGVLMKTSSGYQSNSRQQRQNYQDQSYKEKQLFVAYDSTQIRVFDEMGTHKITMKEPSVVDQLFEEGMQDSIKYKDQSQKHHFKDRAIQLIDHHPYPLLLESNWISLLDTNKYSRHASGCPYIPNIKKLYVQNNLASELYVLTDEKIYKITIKTKDGRDQGKKGICEIQKSIPYFDPQMSLKSPDQIWFKVYKNYVFLNNLIYNMSSNQFLTTKSSVSLLGRSHSSSYECTKFTLSQLPPNPREKKSPSIQKTMNFVLQCTTEAQNSDKQTKTLTFYTITVTKSQSSLLIYIAIGFICVIFFAIKCFRSTQGNYQKQLLFPVNFDGTNNQVRKHNYEQLKKYMEDAKRGDQQQLIKSKGKTQISSNQLPKKTKNKKE